MTPITATFQQLTTIAGNTFTESLRQPVYVVVMLIATLVLIFIPTMAGYTMDDDNQFMLEMSLSTLFFFGMLLAAVTSTGVLSEEIESKTVLTVVSKPVSKPAFVVGKFLGVALAITLAFWVLSLVMLLTTRHQVMQTARDPFDQPVLGFGFLSLFLSIAIAALGNYFYQWSFTATLTRGLVVTLPIAWLLVLVIDKEWHFQSITTEFAEHGSLLGGQLLVGLLLLYQSVIILTAVAIAASTRLGQIMTIVISAGVFFLGVGNNAIFGRFADESTFASFMFHVMPNLQFFWPADALLQHNNFTAGYILMASLYCVLWVGIALAAAIGLFQTRDVG